MIGEIYLHHTNVVPVYFDFGVNTFHEIHNKYISVNQSRNGLVVVNNELGF
jgi:hypothetical protein